MAMRSPLASGRVPALLVLLLLLPVTAEARHRKAVPPLEAPGLEARALKAASPEEQQEIADLQRDGERRVEALMNATRDWKPGPYLRARDRRVEEMRRETYLRQLHVRADYARRRGDPGEAKRMDDLIDVIEHPLPSATYNDLRGIGSRIEPHPDTRR
jgi:hypothetical protein